MNPSRERSSHVQLAVASFEHFIRTGQVLKRPAGLPDELTRTKAGCFVTLHKAGALRGCIGTITPMQSCLADEIIQNAVSAAARDPRFEPVRAEELPEVVCSVDVMGEPEVIESLDQLDPETYGVIVSRGTRRGLLLPDLEGVDTAAEQVAIARRKAGILPREPVRLERFRVTRHT